jgi:hypothetical protein
LLRKDFLLLLAALLTGILLVLAENLWAALSGAGWNAEKVAVVLCHFLAVRSAEDEFHALDQSI